jgi:HSP20 family protein
LWSIDETIVNVEKLYSAVTGKEIPGIDATYAPIPAERDPVEHVEEQLRRLLGAIEGSGGAAPQAAARFAPPLSVFETDSEIVVTVDLPGVKRENVEVSLQGNALTISGERGAPRGKEATLRLQETAFGPFRRTVLVPPDVKIADGAAQMRDGTLEVRLMREPKKDDAPKVLKVN